MLTVGAAILATSAFGQSQLPFPFSKFGSSGPTIGGGSAVPPHAKDHIVLRFVSGVSQQTQELILRKYRLTIDVAASSKFFIVAKLDANDLKRGITPLSISASISRERTIKWAQIDPVLQKDFVPSDAQFADMWHLNNDGINGLLADADVDAPEAWDNVSGIADVVVAVCDDGFDLDHEDLLDNVYLNPGETPGNGLDDDNNGFVDDVTGWDFSSDDNDPRPENGDSHGTHVVGTIAATFDNGVGVTGVGANNIKYMPLRMYGGPNAFMSALANAVDYAWENGAKVISVSYNIDGYTQALDDAVGRAEAADVVYVNSAGNNGQQNPPRQQLRADHQNVVFVVATDSDDSKAWFSNWGTLCEIAAPGVDILSTLPGNSYGLSSGTSMATPLFAGIMGMVRAMDPSMTAREALDQAISQADTVAPLNNIVPDGKRASFEKAIVGSELVTFGLATSMGTWLSGDLNSVLVVDDADEYTVQSTMVPDRGQYAAVDFTVMTGLAPAQVQGIKATFTTKASQEGTTQFTYLYNFTVGDWVLVNTQRVGGTNTEIRLNLRGAFSDYVDPNTGDVMLRCMALQQIRRSGSTLPGTFNYMVDYAKAEVYK